MKIGVLRPMSGFISKTLQDTAMVTLKDETRMLSIEMVPFPMTLNDLR